MSRVNIMELFAQAKQQQSELGVDDDEEDPVSEDSNTGKSNSVHLGPNQVAFIPESHETEFEIVLESGEDRMSELPEFISEPSLVEESVSGSMSVYSHYLSFAQNKSIFVIDTHTGDRFASERPVSVGVIDKLAMNGSHVLLSDGTDVGVVKLVSGSAVGAPPSFVGLVYVCGIAQAADPVVEVLWCSATHFVTVRRSSGWTVWDLARLSLRSLGPEGKSISPEGGICKYKTAISSGNPYDSAEATHGWVVSSKLLLAGKKLSPGVMAILKRNGGSEDVVPPSPSAVSVSVVSFCMCGQFAVAVLSSGVRVWRVTPKTLVVENVSEVSALAQLVDRLEVVDMSSVGESSIGVLHSRGFLEILLDASSGELKTTVQRRVLCVENFNNFLPKSFVVLRENGCVCILLNGGGVHSTLLFVSSCTVSWAHVDSPISAISVGVSGTNPQLFNLYLSSASSGLTAHTVDVSVLREPFVDEESHVVVHTLPPLPVEGDVRSSSSESSRMSQDEDFPHSDVTDEESPEIVTPPERLESTTEFGHGRRPLESPSNHQLGTLLLQKFESLRATEQELFEDNLLPVLDRMVKDCETKFKAQLVEQNKAAVAAVQHILRTQFRSGMSKFFKELETKVLERIDTVMDEKSGERSEINQKNKLFDQIDEKFNALSAAIDLQLVRFKQQQQPVANTASQSGSPVLSVLQEIQGRINSGQLLLGMDTAAMWWKQNKSAGQDVLVTACTALAIQSRNMGNRAPVEQVSDISASCYTLLTLTEWLMETGQPGTPIDMVAAVVSAARYVVSCLISSGTVMSALSPDVLDLCRKSINKCLRNTTRAGAAEELVRDLLMDIRELAMVKFSSTPVSTVPSVSNPDQRGSSILQLVRGNRM